MPTVRGFWVIVSGALPTSFRAKQREDLLPTLRQLQRTQPDTELRWFERNRFWTTPEEAREALAARRRAPESRGRDWRPGGEHKDPRARFKLTRDQKRARFKKRLIGRGRPEGDGGQGPPAAPGPRDRRGPQNRPGPQGGYGGPPTPHRPERKDWSGRQDRADQARRSDRPGRPDQAGRFDRPARPDRPGPWRPESRTRPDRQGPGERRDRPKPEAHGRPDWKKKPDWKKSDWKGPDWKKTSGSKYGGPPRGGHGPKPPRRRKP
jgi:hypothetical protein